jgi:hypothetical protein
MNFLPAQACKNREIGLSVHLFKIYIIPGGLRGALFFYGRARLADIGVNVLAHALLHLAETSLYLPGGAVYRDDEIEHQLERQVN